MIRIVQHDEIEDIRSGQWDDRISSEQRDAGTAPGPNAPSAARRGRPTKAEKERRDRAAAVKAAQEEASTTLLTGPSSSALLEETPASQDRSSPFDATSPEKSPERVGIAEPSAVDATATQPDLTASVGGDPEETSRQDEEAQSQTQSEKVPSDHGGEKRKHESPEGEPQEAAAISVDGSEPEVIAEGSHSSKRSKTEEETDSPWASETPSVTPSAGKRCILLLANLALTVCPIEMDPAARKRFRSTVLQILSQIDLDSCAGFFRVPVQPHEAPAYNTLIHYPIDLKTIGKRVREGKITSSLEFRRDVLLMLSNAVMFNKPDTDVAHDAQRMFELVESLVHVFEASDSI